MEAWKQRFGVTVRTIRKAKGLTQEQLAGEVGIDLTYLGGIERGRRNPSLLVIVKIALALDVAPAALLA